MKRNFFLGVLGGFCGAAILILLLSAVGLVGAQSRSAIGNLSSVDAVSVVQSPAKSSVPNTITYQGRLLKQDGSPETGSCNLAFSLYDDLAAGNLIAGPITNSITITNGFFTTGLDFGSVFNGDARWLGITVDCGSGFEALTPRQPLTAAPYAIRALDTGALQSYPVSSTAPISGQVLKWNGSIWLPGTDNLGSGGITYTNGFGLNLIGNVFNVITSTIQQRVSSSCSSGNAIRVINGDGSVACEPISSGGTYSNGFGLNLNGNTFNVLTNTIQVRVTGTCPVGQYARVINADGSAVCGIDANSGGTITNVTAGFGLTGGGSSGAVALNVVTSAVQSRISGVCSSGNAIRVVNQDGTVICEAVGGSFWSLSGNAGTNGSTNFLGTTDNTSLTIRVSNTVALRFTPTDETPNLIGGFISNTIGGSINHGSTIGGGGSPYYGSNTIQGGDTSYSTIGGGVGNHISGTTVYNSVIGGGSQNVISSSFATRATIGGGAYNYASSSYASIGGGYSNTVTSTYGTVGGGYQNLASALTGDSSTVAGGYQNIASNNNAAVGGGCCNIASGDSAVVSGGYSNTASNQYATVSGGIKNSVSGDTAFVGGGRNNIASGVIATIGGGWYNTASGAEAAIAGGASNNAYGSESAVGGGAGNSASGQYATIPGGYENEATLTDTFAAGNQAQAIHQGTFVWADSTNAAFASTSSDQFLIRAAGGLGLGTNAPLAQLHVSSNGNNFFPLLQLSQTNPNDYTRVRLTNDGSSPSDGYNNRWDIASISTTLLVYSGKYNQTALTLTPGGGTDYLVMGNTAHLTAGGAWTNASDKNLKTNFTEVDSNDILRRIMQLPIATWNYKAEPTNVRHLGPVAQDFYARFGLGADDRSITTVDEGGVALAAIQGLYQENQDLKARVAQLEQAQSPAPFNPFNLISVITLIGFAEVWWRQRKQRKSAS